MIGGLYGKGKSEEAWMGGIGGSKKNFKVHSIIMKVAISFFKKFRVRPIMISSLANQYLQLEQLER